MSRTNELLFADTAVVNSIVAECKEALKTERCPEEMDAITNILAEAEEWLATVADLRAHGMASLRQFRKWAQGCGLPVAGITAYIDHAQACRDAKRKAREAEEAAKLAALEEEIRLCEATLAREGRVTHMADLWPAKKEAA